MGHWNWTYLCRDSPISAAATSAGGQIHLWRQIRISPGLEDNQRLCQPTMESDPQGANENTKPGSGSNPGSSCPEDTTMVRSPDVVGIRLAMPITQTDTQYRVSTHNAVKVFQDKLQNLSSTLGDQKLADHMTHYLGNVF